MKKLGSKAVNWLAQDDTRGQSCVIAGMRRADKSLRFITKVSPVPGARLQCCGSRARWSHKGYVNRTGRHFTICENCGPIWREWHWKNRSLSTQTRPHGQSAYRRIKAENKGPDRSGSIFRTKDIVKTIVLRAPKALDRPFCNLGVPFPATVTEAQCIPWCHL